MVADGNDGRSLAGKVALVTGIAGDIGTATAALLARRGAKIYGIDLSGADFGNLHAAMPDGAELVVERVDVGDEAQVAACIGHVVDRFGRIDILVNGAGIEGMVASIIDYDLAMFDAVFRVNVTGVFLGMKHALPAMLRQGSGSIINLASLAGLSGSPAMSAYIASKHAVIGLTRAAASEVAAAGVRVNCITPGPIRGRMTDAIADAQGPGWRDAVNAAIPAGRFGVPGEVAALVAFLASDEASYCNGSFYAVDGGGNGI